MNHLNNNKFRVMKGGITQVEADAIVNDANTLLLGGRGVDSNIHRAVGLRKRGNRKELNDCKIVEANIF
ncbi:MAG: macro domain-containing protein [Bacteroidota bacterium]|nr:macro domain-containing protein [Bacteroidota bacterium]